VRIVPLNRLLNQPTVQLKWIEQHKQIEFVLDKGVQLAFEQVWKLFQESHAASLFEFLNSEDLEQFCLVEDDHLFALLTGADYIINRYPDFSYELNQPNLVWAI